MISDIKARQFAKRHFPKAPEMLAKFLEVTVRESPMDGCDGWCVAPGSRAIIRINSKLPATRRRFTLAHELGHLILGVPTVVGETFEEMLRSNTDEERRVNDLASELLMPADVVEASLPELPVVAAALKQLAKKANVSELAAAVRVCNLASEIGLLNASVVFFDCEQIRWQWSRTLKISNNIAGDVLAEARKAAPGAFRRPTKKGEVIVASIIENPFIGSAALFLQLLPSELGMKLSRNERRRELEGHLFANNKPFYHRVSGMMGFHKTRLENKTPADSEADFWRRYREVLKNSSLDSNAGREYVKLRVSEWF